MTLPHAIAFPLRDEAAMTPVQPIRCNLPGDIKIDTKVFLLNKEISRGARYTLYSTNTFAFRELVNPEDEALVIPGDGVTLNAQAETVRTWLDSIGDNRYFVRKIEVPFPVSCDANQAAVQARTRDHASIPRLDWLPTLEGKDTLTTLIFNLGDLARWRQSNGQMGGLLEAVNWMAQGLGQRMKTVIVVDNPGSLDNWRDPNEPEFRLQSESFRDDTDRRLVEGLQNEIIGVGWLIRTRSEWGWEYARNKIGQHMGYGLEIDCLDT